MDFALRMQRGRDRPAEIKHVVAGEAKIAWNRQCHVTLPCDTSEVSSYIFDIEGLYYELVAREGFEPPTKGL
jgi:hypothetical protein